MNRLLPLALAAVAVGCGDGGPPPLPPAPFATVTLDGKPAGGLALRVVAADESVAGSGTTGGDGRAVLRGPGDQPVPPGRYKVVVTDLGDAEDNPMEQQKAKPKSRVPASYGKPVTTPLTLTVEAGKMEYPLEVKSKG